jgi:hypothetical protein
LGHVGPDNGEAGVGEQVPGEYGLTAVVRAVVTLELAS